MSTDAILHSIAIVLACIALGVAIGVAIGGRS